MTLFNIFKKPSSVKAMEGKGKKIEQLKKTEKKAEEKKQEEASVQEVVVKKAKEKKISEFAYRILKSPHITEKATDLVEKNQYVFRVFPDVNKTEIKKTVEDLYGVEVERVNIIHNPAKKRRLGRTGGWREGLEKGYKKAIVKIKKGQKIEVLPR